MLCGLIRVFLRLMCSLLNGISTSVLAVPMTDCGTVG